MIDIDEFRKYLKIDKLSLDDEVERQPSLFYEVSEAYAEAVGERDDDKETLAIIDAELDAQARNSKEKITEAQVKSYIQTNSEHQIAFDTWLESKKLADRLGALKEAFQQRSYMLRDLVSLHNSNYFEESSLRSNASEDKLVYNKQRVRLANARENRNRD